MRPGPEAGAHGGHLGGEGIGEQEGRLPRVQSPLQLGVNEAVADDLVVAAIDQGQPGPVEIEGGLGWGLGGGGGGGMAGGDAGVAMDAADFRDEVHLVHQVEATAGGGHLPALGRRG
jgi:hypothetical protein